MFKLYRDNQEYGKEIIFETFPNGELHLKTEQFKEFLGSHKVKVLWRFEGNSDFLKLSLIKWELDKLLGSGGNVSLFILYLPYSRMDREIEGSLFSLMYIQHFINSQHFGKVEILEPHSEVACKLIRRSISHNILSYDNILDITLDSIGFNRETDVFMFPDKGAKQRYSEHINETNAKVITAVKARDLQTGQITSLELEQPVQDIKDRKVLIIDDLCSYGGTFIKSAKLLKDLGAKEVFLLVAHCENSIHKGEILTTDYIDSVFTTDSMKLEEHKKIKIFNLTGKA
jgi:ribose-phosphate pyrophosphokinase